MKTRSCASWPAPGSANHQLLLDLTQRGASLVGTEDPQLLLREYQLQRQQLGAATPAGQAAVPSPRDAAELLAARDGFIAVRIAETLRDAEIGLLFLGAAHAFSAGGLADTQVETLR